MTEGKVVVTRRPAGAAEVVSLSGTLDAWSEPEARADRSTAEGRFALDLEARLAAAPDERSRRVLELARSLGREALLGRLPAPPPLEEF